MKMKNSKLISLFMLLAVTLALGVLASCEGTPAAEQRMTDPDGVWRCQYVLYSKTECAVGDWTTEYKQEHEYLDHVFLPLQIKDAKVVRFGLSSFISSSYYQGAGKIFLPYTMKEVWNASGRTFMVSGDRLTNMTYGYYYVPQCYYEYYCNKFSEEDAPYKANVVYDINYENEYKYHSVDNYEYGSLIEIIPPDPEREGYKFDGWYKEAECVNKWDYEKDTLPEEILDEEGNTVFQEIALYAKWILSDDTGTNDQKPNDDPNGKPVPPTIEAPLETTVLDYAGELNVKLKAEEEGFYTIELPKAIKVDGNAGLMRYYDSSENCIYVKYFDKQESIELNLSGEYASNPEISFSAVTEDLLGVMNEAGKIAPSDKVRAFTITNSTEEEISYIVYCMYDENGLPAPFGAYTRYDGLTTGQTISKDNAMFKFSVVKGQTACIILGSGGKEFRCEKSNVRYEWYLDGERIYGNKLYLKQENKTYDLRLRKVVDGVTVDEDCELLCEYSDLLVDNQLNIYDCRVGSEIDVLFRWDASEILEVYVLPAY